MASRRAEVIRGLQKLNIALVTTPNYSLFTDQPRWDDLHSMKRIALVHQEFLNEACRQRYTLTPAPNGFGSVWRNFISERPEVTHLAFEFATGAGREGRLDWHADQLSKLPLHLIVRGGITIMLGLPQHFTLTCLETSTFLKKMWRKAATARPDGVVRWKHAPTERNEQLDALLNANLAVVAGVYAQIISASRKAA